MLLESRRVRSWLSQTAIVAADRHPADIVEPASASFSFNPFPGRFVLTFNLDHTLTVAVISSLDQIGRAHV